MSKEKRKQGAKIETEPGRMLTNRLTFITELPNTLFTALN